MSRFQEIEGGGARYGSIALRSISRFGPIGAGQEMRIREAMDHSVAQPIWSQLVGEGETFDRPRILLAGWAARVRSLPDGRRQILSFFLPGDIFDVSLSAQAGVAAPIVSLTRVVFARFPTIADPINLVGGGDSVSAAFREYHRLEQVYLLNQLVRIGRQTPYERMAHLLLEFYYRLKAMGFFQGNGYVLPLTQEVLADALALSHVHTNRTLQQLRRDGLIATHRSTVMLVDLPRLTQIADFKRPFVPDRQRCLE